MGYKPEYDKKTTVEERAEAYAAHVQYVGGEVKLAMHAAVLSAYIEGYRDRRAEEYYPVNTAESFEGYLKRRLGDNYSAIVIAALDAQAPLQVSDEMVRAAKRILFHESEDCDDEVRAAIEAALATPRGAT